LSFSWTAVYGCASVVIEIEVAGALKARTKWGTKRRRRIILPKVKNDGSDIALSGPFSNREIAEIFLAKEFHTVDFRDFKLIDLAAAAGIAEAAKIEILSAWNKITRPALSDLMKTPGLKEAIVLEFRGSGRLRDFDKAADVETFRSFHPLVNTDIAQIAKLPKLHTLVAHRAEFGLRAVDKIRAIETLRVVDFEAASFTDEMAESLSRSTTITHLGLPATQLTKAGFNHISEMAQLMYLDVWANRLSAEDFDVLAGHPNLEIIELGGGGDDDDERKPASAYIPKLEKMPALTTVYFEGVRTTDEEAAYLNSRYTFRNL
jgi:hypothetical protein